MRWQVLVPIRPDSAGKSRLRAEIADPDLHLRLVQAIQQDTISAIIAARELAAAGHGGEQIHEIRVISGQGFAKPPDGVLLVGDPGGGLNIALRVAATASARARPTAAVIALVADLPSLRPDEFLAVLAAAAEVDRGFVPDLAGSGTTMLTAAEGMDLNPRFGPGSARAHQRDGAVELPAAPGARGDVDTMADLRRELVLGTGCRTQHASRRLQPSSG